MTFANFRSVKVSTVLRDLRDRIYELCFLHHSPADETKIGCEENEAQGCLKETANCIEAASCIEDHREYSFRYCKA